MTSAKSFNDKPIGLFVDVGSHCPQLRGHRRNAIAFLDPQFGGPGDLSRAVGNRRRHAQDGEFIDCLRNVFDADLPHHFENRGSEPAEFIAVVAAGLRRS